MMSIPFFGLFLAMAAGLGGYRLPAFLLWLASMAALVALFKMHATDALNIAL